MMPEEENQSHNPSQRKDEAYPEELRTREAKLLGQRQEKKKDAGEGEFNVGLALSGGGLRSATFSLGMLQALARMRALDKVDALSTVSGGGYTGSMISRLFCRRSVHGVEDVERAILPRWNEDSEKGDRSVKGGERIKTGSVFRWLQDNGHHLAPNGGGDLFLAAAVIVRNWMSVQAMLVALLLAVFTLMQLLRHLGAEVSHPGMWPQNAGESIAWIIPEVSWWNPWFTVALLGFGLSILLSLTYWILQYWPKRWPFGVRDLGPSSGHCPSVWLKYSLLVTGALVVAALVDTLGQIAYVSWRTGEVPIWVKAVPPVVVALMATARRLAIVLFGKGGAERPKIRLRVVAGVVASAIFVVWMTSVNAISHGIAWGGRLPRGAPCEVAEVCSSIEVATTRSQEDLVCWLLGLTIASFILGRCRRFLNDSTLQPLYAARIVRAFLGASNPDRIGEKSYNPVTRVVCRDDMAMPWEEQGDCGGFEQFPKGAPLHFVNVTVNENLDNKTRLQRPERGGIGMAVGPAGISAGVRHHVVATCSSSETKCLVYPQNGETSFRMFEYDPEGCGKEHVYKGEKLTLGQWTGISGAAFSTGLGSRTSLSLSYLLGIFNVRLGYWWDSGVRPAARLSRHCQRMHCKESGAAVIGSRNWMGRAFSRVFPAHSYLLDEFVARFHGTGRRSWNLSDGGHFENLGAYELIRRRVPLIVIVDAEADPDYVFEGLGNLVRKARSDFHAKIRFLGEEEVLHWRKKDPDGCRRYFGTLDRLRRGSWDPGMKQCPDDTEETEAPTFGGADRTGNSLVHAALAEICYEGRHEPDSILIYVKPTLVGDEPVDLKHYHEKHPDFPQQTTTDQFFDEAQWESYRALGDLIGRRVLMAFADVDPRKCLRTGWPERTNRARV